MTDLHKQVAQRDIGESTPERRLGLVALSFYYVLCTAAGGLIANLLSAVGLNRLSPFVVEGGLYAVLLILPLSYAFSPDVFTKPFWRLNQTSFKWTLIVVLVQAFVINLRLGSDVPFSKARAFSAVLIVPAVEEIMRAVMIRPLVDRWGPFWGVAVVSILDAIAHPAPYLVVAQLTALSLMFVYGGRSVAANAVAHCLINAVAVARHGIAPT